jgi:hypothetical protein
LAIEVAERRYETIQGHAQALEQDLWQRDEALRRAGHTSPELLFGEVRRLGAENAELLRRLSTMPGDGDPDVMRRLRTDHEQCAAVRARLEMVNGSSAAG